MSIAKGAILAASLSLMIIAAQANVVAAGITVKPASLSFPKTPVGTVSAVETVTLSNLGKTAVSIESVTPTGPFAVSADATTCGSTIAVGEKCDIGVIFNPIGGSKPAGMKETGNLSVVDSAKAKPQKIMLTGIAVGLIGPTTGIFVTSTVSNVANYGEVKSYTFDSDEPVLLDTLSGTSTELTTGGFLIPFSIAVDSSGNIYVAVPDSANSAVNIYPAGSNGDVAPIATIAGPNTGLDEPRGIALDSGGNIYVTNFLGHTVTVYPPGSNGNVTPVATIERGGPTPTGDNALDNPWGIALDSSGNIYVAGNHVISVFPAGSNGITSPIANIVGPKTRLVGALAGLALDSDRNIYVANYYSSSINVFSAGSDGNVKPIATIKGPKTGLAPNLAPESIALDPSGNIYVGNAQHGLLYRAGSNGNVKPITTIGGGVDFIAIGPLGP
jgi:sugar lactone lactonase YvrE